MSTTRSVLVFALLFLQTIIVHCGESEEESAQCDAYIMAWQVRKVASVLREMQVVMDAALKKADNGAIDKRHLEYVARRAYENSTLLSPFLGRGFNHLDQAYLRRFTDYHSRFFKLIGRAEDHLAKTNRDMYLLKTAKFEVGSTTELPSTLQRKTGSDKQNTDGGLGEPPEAGEPLCQTESLFSFNVYRDRLKTIIETIDAIRWETDDFLNDIASCCKSPPHVGDSIEPLPCAQEFMDSYKKHRKSIESSQR